MLVLVSWQHRLWWLQRQEAQVALRHVLHIEAMWRAVWQSLDIENALDLEGKNSDIYHVINCISHFFWIMYIVY